MARIIVTALAVLSMLYVGIQSLSFRSQTISDTGLSGASQEAYNMTDVVAQDAIVVSANALPLLFVIVLLALLVGVLALSR